MSKLADSLRKALAKQLGRPPKKTELQKEIARMTSGKGTFKESARTEPISGASYSASPGFGTATVGKRSVAAGDTPAQANVPKATKKKIQQAVALEIKGRTKKLTQKEKAIIADVKKTDKERFQSALKAQRKAIEDKKTKAKGVSLAGSEKVGGRRVATTNEYKNQKDFRGDKIKVDAYGQPKGNTITADGEIIGNPTERMMEQAARSFIARNATPRDRRIKAQIAELKRRSPKGELTEKVTDPKTGEVTGVLKSKVGSRNQSRTVKDTAGVTNPVRDQRQTFKKRGNKIGRGMGVALRGGGAVSKR